MRKILRYTMVLLLPFLGACNGRDAVRTIPAAVQSTFLAKFPDAGHARWSRESDSSLEADFEQDGRHCSALFALDGKWMESETPVSFSALPLAVMQTINNGFGDHRLKKAASVSSPSLPACYEVTLVNAMETLKVQLNAEGVILNKKVVKASGRED